MLSEKEVAGALNGVRL